MSKDTRFVRIELELLYAALPKVDGAADMSAGVNEFAKHYGMPLVDLLTARLGIPEYRVSHVALDDALLLVRRRADGTLTDPEL
jgi:hypothetical protein